MNNIIGVDGGPSIFGYVDKPGVEMNVHYYLNYKAFLFKPSLGITPNTNFGNLTQFYVALGFTSRIDKIISVHLLYGTGKTWVERDTYNSTDSNGDPYTYGYASQPLWFGQNPFASLGVYFKPIKSQGLLIGVDAIISRLGLEQNYLFAYNPTQGSHFVKAKYIVTKPFSFNFVLSYKLNKEKK